MWQFGRAAAHVLALSVCPAVPPAVNTSGPPWVCTALGVSPQPLPAPLDVLQPILEVHLGLQHAAGQGEAQAPWDGGPPLGFEEPSAEGG